MFKMARDSDDMAIWGRSNHVVVITSQGDVNRYDPTSYRKPVNAKFEVLARLNQTHAYLGGYVHLLFGSGVRW
jgi:hypothetical protein